MGSIEDALKVKDMKDANIKINMKLPPTPLQKVGALFMYVVKKCFVLDDPGTGKTVESIAYMKMLQSYGKIENLKVLVVTLSGLVYQWRDEVKKFSNLIPVVVDGSTAARHRIYSSFAEDNRQVLIMNYSKINYDFEQIYSLDVDAVIFDEASALKDSTTKQYKLYFEFTKKIKRIAMLTATPIANNLEDFYNLFALFHNNILPDYFEFRNRFLETKEITIRKGNRVINKQVVVGSKNIREFRDLIFPYFIRRENENNEAFIDFKLIIEKTPIPLTEEQKRMINSVKLDHLADKKLSALRAFSDFTKIACCPQIFSKDNSNISPKAIEMIALVKSLNTKVVIYARFLEYHRILRSYLDLAKISYCSITGEQTPKEKDKSKNLFNTDSDVKVMLLTGAGKFGLNLQVSNKIILMDLPYTPAEVFQLIGRVYRTGQEKDVTAYFIYHVNSLEEELFASLLRKQKEIDEFFEQNKSDIFILDKSSDLNVKESFLSKDYMKGESYSLTEEKLLLVPEKEDFSSGDEELPVIVL